MTTLAERQEKGKALRNDVPRADHGTWIPATNRSDPLQLLQAQDEGRLQNLLPIKYGRMVASPFAFLRGSAAVMAADLAPTPVTGLDVILCGDAHLSNFGLFASPERRLIFDINDFDEVYPGPWEWDLKRLAASAVVASRENGFKESVCREMGNVIGRTYANAIQRFAEIKTLDMWYYHVDADFLLKVFDEHASIKGSKKAAKTVKKARSRTQERTLAKLTEIVDGRRRIISDPPLLVPFREDILIQITGDKDSSLFIKETIKDAWLQYVDSLPIERRLLLQRYRIIDFALRVGGVGSVGTRCSIVLLENNDIDDALILQVKEAGSSVLESYLGDRGYKQHAERVVIGQRLTQTTSDIFLGWHRSSATEIDYYWRQLKDMKGSAEVDMMDASTLETYLKLCSWTLARAHARTGDAAIISGYLGKGKRFSQALADFAVAYADQTERDHQALVEAIQSGRIIAETGI